MGGGKILVLSEAQGGVSHARNVGIEHAKGEWLTFVDADDRIEPNHLELLYNATLNDEPDIVVGGYMQHNIKFHRNEKHEAVGEATLLTKEQLVHAPDLLVYVWDKLFRKALLIDNASYFDETMSYGEDTVLVYGCALSTDRIKAIPLSGYIHVVTGSSAIDRYHAGMYSAYSRILNLKCELMKCAITTASVMEGIRLCHKRSAARLCVANLFLPGSPLTFKERVCEVRRIVFDDPDVQSSMVSEDRTAHSVFQRIVDATFDWQSPIAMTLVYQLLLPPVTFYRHYISWRFRS